MRKNILHFDNLAIKRLSGFTLIELLIVISIIGILVAIAAASYITAQQQARDARRISDMKSMQSAWELYFADNGQNYPGDSNSNPCSLTLMTSPSTYLPGGFPTDPKTNPANPNNDILYPVNENWSRCSSTSYCFCAGVELLKNQNSKINCAGNESADFPNGFYCVHNLQ